ncbi:MAG: tetratricopeptide repeat protein [Opitutaceae bacterium]|nr:tetratricopeptide repeat protein [Opitutaceae bacterium]
MKAKSARYCAVLLLLAGPLFPAAAPAPAPATLPAAIELFTARRYPEARDALARLVAAEPDNAAAHHYLGRTLTVRHDLPAIEEGLRHLARAAELEPRNAVYLGIYGGASLQHAGRTNSLLAATRGREAMEKALALDPDYLDAREGLFQFYQRAPWPLGSSAKAAAQLEEIRRRDPDLATVLSVGVRLNARDYAGAFRLCDEVLARQPANYTALYHYGRCASISGQNLERGLACLQQCLTLEPPTPAAPSHSHVWYRIGVVQERRQQPEEARAAYRAALERDPHNRQASEALARLP